MSREMKDSGVEWIGDIPNNWVVTKVGRLGNYINGYAFKPESWGDEGLPIIRIQNLTNPEALFNKFAGDIDNKYLIKKDDYLISWSATLDVFRWNREDSLLNQHIFKVELNDEVVDRDFFYWLAKVFMNEMNNDKHGSAMQHVTKRVFNSFAICIPNKDEQMKIAAVLKNKVDYIDSIINSTNTTLVDYKLLKQSIITEAVTKGLDKNVEMKDSGIEWVGEIPKHWDVLQVKYIVKWKSDKNNPDAEVLSLYRDFGIVPKNSRDDNHNVTSFDTSGYKVVGVGDLVINKMKAWQGSLAVSEYEGIVSPAYHVAEFINNKVHSSYFHHLMRNQVYLPEYRRLSTGMRIGQWDLSFDSFKNLRSLIPPMHEQIEIVKSIENQSQIIDGLIDKKERLIIDLEEFKKSLIYEYVTGKKEVE